MQKAPGDWTRDTLHPQNQPHCSPLQNRGWQPVSQRAGDSALTRSETKQTLGDEVLTGSLASSHLGWAGVPASLPHNPCADKAPGSRWLLDEFIHPCADRVEGRKLGT